MPFYLLATYRWIFFLLLIMICQSSYGQILDTIKLKLDAYRMSTDNTSQSIIGNEIMELDYTLSIADAQKLKHDYITKSRQTNDPTFEMLANMVLGDVFYYKNNLDSSFYYYLRQAQIGESIKEYQSSVTGYINAAYVLEVEGKTAEAIQLIKRADRIAKKSEPKINMSSGYYNLALIHHKSGKPDSASHYIKKVIESDRKNNDLRGMVHNLQFLVDLELRSGNIEDARKYCQQCLDLSQKSEYKRGLGLCQYSKAFIEYQAGHTEAAIVSINESIATYRQRKDSTSMGKLVRLKANILSQVQPERAEQLFLEAISMGKQANNLLQLCKTGVDLTRFYLAKGQNIKAQQQIDKVEDWIQGKGLVDIEEEVLDLQYEIYNNQNNTKAALQVIQQKEEFLVNKIENLIESNATNVSQSYELFEMERELQRVDYENRIQQMKTKRRTYVIIALGMLFLLTTLLAYYAFQNQKNKNIILQKSAEEDQLRSENLVLEKELDALRSQMNPHFLFNSLNSINDYIMHQEPRLASKYLTKFSKLMRVILNNSKKKFVTLEEELEAIDLYMAMEKLRFSDKFDYHIKAGEEVPTGNFLIPAMLLQPYLENAVKHGIKNMEGHGNITVDISAITSEQLKIVIYDNGIGRKKAIEIKNKQDKFRKSYGLEITSDRIALLNKIYGVNAQLSYVDHEHPSGTSVILILNTIKKDQLKWKNLKPSSSMTKTTAVLH